MSSVITLWELLIRCQTTPSSQRAVTSSHDYPLTSLAPDSGCR
jgi:hypothetical protein